MIIDSSALIALILREPGYERIEAKLEQDEAMCVAAPTFVECAVVLAHKLGRDPRMLLQRLFEQFEIEVIPFDPICAERAVDAFLSFGKGRHPAGLNLLDCMALATSVETGQELVYIGHDFEKALGNAN